MKHSLLNLIPRRGDTENQRSLHAIAQWMWVVVRGNRLQIMLNAIIGVMEVVASLLYVWAIKNAIDVATLLLEEMHAAPSAPALEHTAATATTQAAPALEPLYWAVGIMAAIIIFDFGMSSASVWVRNILGVRAQNNMQQRMLDRILRSEWQSKSKHHSGDILNRLETDVTTVVNFLTETLPSALSTLLLFLGAFAYLYILDHLLALITIAVVPLCIVLSKFYMSKMRRLNRKVRSSDSDIQAVMQETVQNLMLLKTLNGNSTMLARLSDSQHTLQQRVKHRTFFSLLSNITLNLGFAFSYLLVFLWSAVRMASGTLSFGGMTAFLQLVNRIQSPARNLARLLPQAVSAITSADRLMDLEAIPAEEEGDAISMPAPCGISISGVTFKYPDSDNPVFRNFSHTFQPGTATAIVGETGAGKTTLIRLLLALMRPAEGRMTLFSQHDGQPEIDISPMTRCNFVYVPQGNTLMSGTIRDNLLLGKADATDEEMQAALRRSCADFVNELPEGLDTRCSEAGGGLSEGQAQRITIARALLRNRPVMLFDESTSALDPATERQLLSNVLSTHDKTVIFITHRMAVCDYCDEVLRLRNI